MPKEGEPKPEGIQENFYYFFVKGSETSKKIDMLVFIGGGVVFVFNPALGGFIIAGNAVTYVAADQVERGAQKRLDKIQVERLQRKGAIPAQPSLAKAA